MDDFNNINNINNINNNPENTEGKLNGFDSADNIKSDSGYTVTPEGGFYTRQKEDIIQDEVVSSKPEPEPQPQPEPVRQEPPKTNFYPTGNYSQYGYGPVPPYAKPPKSPKPPKVKKPKKEKRYGAGIVVVASLLAAVIGTVGGAAVAISYGKPEKVITESTDKGTTNVNINVDETVQSVVEAVAKKATPSVVGIRTTTSVMNFFGGSQEATGDGSGVVYSSDGYIITNYHVIADALSNRSGSKIEVYLDSLDSESYLATVVGYNISSDLAVIKIDANGLTPAEFADSSALKVGQYVITIGNPGGLEFMDSVTYGVISGLNRVVSSDSGVSLIQTDAAINPGNSGGALLSTEGKLVGINSSKIVSEEFEGMGFAIPSNTVKEICDNIIAREDAPEPYVGISISERYTSEVLSFYGFPSGAVVLSVADGSPAEEAGLQKGDIITEFGGTEISEYTMFEELLKECSPEDKVDMIFYRSGRYYTTKITIGSNN